VTDRSRVCSGFASICRSRRAASVPERFAGGCGRRGAEGTSHGSKKLRMMANGRCRCARVERRGHQGACALVGGRHSKAHGSPEPFTRLEAEMGAEPDFGGVRREARQSKPGPGASEARQLRAPSEENTGSGRSDGGSKRVKRREARHPPDGGLARRHGTSARSSGARL
jgi:hypothetical protein